MIAYNITPFCGSLIGNLLTVLRFLLMKLLRSMFRLTFFYAQGGIYQADLNAFSQKKTLMHKNHDSLSLSLGEFNLGIIIDAYSDAENGVFG